MIIIQRSLLSVYHTKQPKREWRILPDTSRWHGTRIFPAFHQRRYHRASSALRISILHPHRGVMSRRIFSTDTKQFPPIRKEGILLVLSFSPSGFNKLHKQIHISDYNSDRYKRKAAYHHRRLQSIHFVYCLWAEGSGS